MADIKQKFTSETLVVTGLNSLAVATTGSTGVATSTEVDNTVKLYLAADIRITIDPTAATTGNVDVYLMRANATGDYGTAEVETTLLHTHLVSINPAFDDPQITIRAEQLPKFWKLMFVNNSDVVLDAATNSADYEGTYLINA